MIKPRKRLVDDEALAVHFGVPRGTIRYWASKYSWTRYRHGGRVLRDLGEAQATYDELRPDDREDDLVVDSERSAWAVVRRNPATVPDEVLAVVQEQQQAVAMAAELGTGHDAQQVPVCSSGQRWTVVHTWRCQAVLRAGFTPEVGQPVRLEGASVLVLDGRPVPVVESVRVDQEAAGLASSVLGARVVHLYGYAASAQRAQELVRAGVEELERRGEP
ncbi:hypothetical protein [Umezawaea beigongshangensis]|uniref:hypothetical protein n=1 Tax=Umezawaea beigongshangensis TaxID=2780383 RepID=UPI0018F1B3AC|nr:hypothetical protein [Umezawaea beigongshangensis]